MRELCHLWLRHHVAATRQWPRGSLRTKANGRLSSVGVRHEVYAPSREYQMLRRHGHSGPPSGRLSGKTGAPFDHTQWLSFNHCRAHVMLRGYGERIHRNAARRAQLSSIPVVVLISSKPMQRIVGRLAISRQKSRQDPHRRSGSQPIAGVQRKVHAGRGQRTLPFLPAAPTPGPSETPADRQHPFYNRGAARWQIFI
ncbi:hypothetical protein ACVIM8_003355 [Bradyrhizobium sp. USDA 4529]